jgi:hypothetical protein
MPMPSVVALLLPLIKTADERAVTLPIRVAVVSRLNNTVRDNYADKGFPHR